VLRLLELPVDDYLAAVDACFSSLRVGNAIAALVGLVGCWWIYVPIHELLHVAGCLLGGGEVTRLEMSPLYGAALLGRVFPFIAVGSDYAGQLTGFDTKGSDLTYLLTDFLPFTLTILIGVPLLRSAARERERPLAAWLKLGAAIPIAYAPFISLTGDYYEMGSILVSRAVALAVPGFAPERWRSDDLVKLAGELLEANDASALDVGGVGAAFLVGALLALATYALGRAWDDVLSSRSARS
jgi:uncharacterized protein (DUF2062 family)